MGPLAHIALFDLKGQFFMVGEDEELYIPPPEEATFEAKAQFEMVGKEPDR